MTNTKTNNKAFVETYGCQMNVYDTELVQTILTKNGYEMVKSEDDANIIMLNTCSVRDNANRKIYNRVHQIRNGREEPVLIGILGCMATNFKTDLLDNKSLKIDFIAGPDSYKHLPNLIKEAQTGEKTFDVTLSEFETYSDVYPSRQGGPNAWIAIMRGCNNYCTFCVVPYTRGRERSRSPESIVEEVKKLVAEGYKQVTLLGQNVNSYKYVYDDQDESVEGGVGANNDGEHAAPGENIKQATFTDLMDMVSQVEGIERIRFTSPHPKDFPTDLLELMAKRNNICKQIHLPLQAGSSRVLKKMNRTYSKEEFLDLVDHIRTIMPDVSFSTDIILGFPTETDEEYMETEDVVKKVRFDSAYIFKYSERPNTTAARRFPDDVPEEKKKHRIMRLNAIQKDISLEKNQEKIGHVQKVLIEKKGTKRDENEWQGRNDANLIVILPPNSNLAIGQFIDVTITEATPNVLKGEYLSN